MLKSHCGVMASDSTVMTSEGWMPIQITVTASWTNVTRLTLVKSSRSPSSDAYPLNVSATSVPNVFVNLFARCAAPSTTSSAPATLAASDCDSAQLSFRSDATTSTTFTTAHFTTKFVDNFSSDATTAASTIPRRSFSASPVGKD